MRKDEINVTRTEFVLICQLLEKMKRSINNKRVRDIPNK